MNDSETLIAVFVFIWILWPFIATAVVWMVRAALDAIERLSP